MTDLIKTFETDLMRKGDKCTYITYQIFWPEHGITAGKSYEGTILEPRVSSVTCQLTNDFGKTVIEDMINGGHAGNGATVQVAITSEDYKYRVMEANAKAVAKAEQDYQEHLDRLKTYCDKRLEKLIVTN